MRKTRHNTWLNCVIPGPMWSYWEIPLPYRRILFDYDVDAVSGTKVVDPTLALRCISEGTNFWQIKGTRR
ncbi:MAG: hypothetical protein H8D67_03745 [Deltaproteobacteria bacterium]|nr:hypothetical protein [Deltaproteobacteria bacterium]